MTTLRTDPSPGTTPADGTTIKTDQHNEIVSRIGGANRLTASKFVVTDSSGFLTTSTDLPLAAGSLTTTNITVLERTDIFLKSTLAVQPTAGNKEGIIVVLPHGSSHNAHYDALNDPTNDSGQYARMGISQSYGFIGVYDNGGGSAPFHIETDNRAWAFADADGSLSLPGPLNVGGIVDSLLSSNHYYWYYDDMNYSGLPNQRYITEGTFYRPPTPYGTLEMVTGNLAGDRARLGMWAEVASLDPALAFTLIMTTNQPDTSKLYTFLGMVDAVPTAAVPPIEPDNAIYFRCVMDAATAHWFGVCRNGATESAVDLGQNASTTHEQLKIIRTASGVDFYIDGTLKGTITTNVPTAKLFTSLSTIAKNVATARVIALEQIALYAKRP